jgi:hypothetical protein
MPKNRIDLCLDKVLRCPRDERDWSDQLFATVEVMKDFIEDRYFVDWGFVEVEGPSDFKDEISGLMERSCYSLSEVVYHFAKEADGLEWVRKLGSLLLHFFQDQLETRQRLLKSYWDRLKAQQLMTPRPELASIGGSIGRLCKLIEGCVYDGDEVLRAYLSESTDDEVHPVI